jgi:hypothetical protein
VVAAAAAAVLVSSMASNVALRDAADERFGTLCQIHLYGPKFHQVLAGLV